MRGIAEIMAGLRRSVRVRRGGWVGRIRTRRRMHPAVAAFASLALVVLFGAGIEQAKNAWDASQIVSGTLAVSRGGSGAAPGAGDQVLVSDSTSAATWRSVPNCVGSTSALNYTAATNSYSCATISAGVDTSGTPANNQIAIFTDADTIEGDANFTWDAATFAIVSGTLAADDESFTLTATQPASPTGTQTAIDATVTSAGSASQVNRAMSISYAAGYSGSSNTKGLAVTNSVNGTALTIETGGGNTAIEGTYNGSSQSGTGVHGIASVVGSNKVAIGVTGAATGTIATTHNFGVIGYAAQGSVSTAISGLFLLTAGGAPTGITAPIVADNNAVAAPIQIWNDNNAEVARVADGGNLGLGDTSPDFAVDITKSSTAAVGIAVINTNGGAGADSELALGDADGARDWTICQDASGGITADALSIGTTACGTGTKLTIDSNGVYHVGPSAQTISAGNTVTADACGSVKRITAAGAVTTDTTNTFTAPAAGNADCCMDVINTGANAITLDNNANFFSAGAADVVLGANDTVRVCSTGASGAWFQIGATGNN